MPIQGPWKIQITREVSAASFFCFLKTQLSILSSNKFQITMNSLLIYGSVQANPLYNCSAKPASQWTDELGTQRIFLGVILIIFGIIVEILYVPCLGAIYKKKLLQHSCYKIMFLLGITDMLTTCKYCTLLLYFRRL